MNLKKEIIKILLGICYIIAIIAFIRRFELGRWGVIITLCLSSLVMQLYNSIKNHQNFNLKTYLIVCLYITGLIHLIGFLGKYGVLGYILSIVIICTAILWKKRKQYMEVKHHIETMLWGKPLYKYREKGKKPPKLEIGF